MGRMVLGRRLVRRNKRAARLRAGARFDLARLLATLDGFNSLMSTTAADDAAALAASVSAASLSTGGSGVGGVGNADSDTHGAKCILPYGTTVVESSHTGYDAADESKTVRVPGSTHLLLSFDPLCSCALEGEQHHVVVGKPFYEGSSEITPISPALRGGRRGGSWPRRPIVVEGDTCVFQYKFASHSMDWGYVRGETMEGNYEVK